MELAAAGAILLAVVVVNDLVLTVLDAKLEPPCSLPVSGLRQVVVEVDPVL